MAAPQGGYFGKILDIDLTSGKSSVRTLDEAMYRKFLGGTGLATYFMYTEIPKNTDPLAPDNLLIFAVGPLNGTQSPGSRMSVNFKNAFNGMFGNSFVGGAFPSELKWAGWDMIIFRGKAPKPVYVSIVDDKVEIRDAKKIWGKDTHTGEELVKKELKNPDAKVMIIGPAGENKVPVACIMSERFKSAARGGGGAVMGSKNLKAVAVAGTKAVPIARREDFHKVAADAVRLCAKNDRSPGYRLYGTAISIEENQYYVGSLATRNYSSSWFADVNNLGAEEASRTFWQRHVACTGCQIHCMKFGVLRNHPQYEGLLAEGPEYESGVMEGSNLGISDFGEMMHLIEKCDALGLDNIGSGNVVAFTMELAEKGLITPEELDGITPQWGDVESASALFEAMAYKKGKAGELLGQGVYAVSQKIGKGSEHFAIQCKKQGFAAHDPRGNRGRMHSYCLGSRGGHHHDGDNAPGLVNHMIASSMCMCDFINGTWRDRAWTMLVDLINPLCGWDMTMEELTQAGKRIVTLQRAYSHREGGVSRKDDMPPPRMMKEPLPEGPKKGEVITPESIKKAQDDYYAYVGWDADGVPTKEILTAYGLDFALDSLKK